MFGASTRILSIGGAKVTVWPEPEVRPKRRYSTSAWTCKSDDSPLLIPLLKFALENVWCGGEEECEEARGPLPLTAATGGIEGGGGRVKCLQ